MEDARKRPSVEARRPRAASAKDSLEDLAQLLSKVFKDGSKIWRRRKRPPEIKAIAARIAEVVESGHVLTDASAELLQAIKDLLSAANDLDTKIAERELTASEQWAMFERSMLSKYENFAGLMRAAGYHVPQVRNFKLSRSLFHSANALGVVYMAEHWWSTSDLVLISGCCTACAWLMEGLKVSSDGFKRVMFQLLGSISRDGEQHNINSATWYMSAMLILALFFPKIASCIGTLSLGVGDPAAALIGSKFGSIRIFGKKTLEGTLAFFISSFLASLAYVYLHYAIPTPQAALLAGAGSLVGAVAELYCTWIDDNLFVPVMSALAVLGTIRMLDLAV